MYIWVEWEQKMAEFVHTRTNTHSGVMVQFFCEVPLPFFILLLLQDWYRTTSRHQIILVSLHSFTYVNLIQRRLFSTSQPLAAWHKARAQSDMMSSSYFPRLPFFVCPVGWGCRIHQLHLCRGIRFSNECPRYDAKESDGEASVMLELWGM